MRRVALISSTEAVVDFIVEFVHALDATHCGGGFGIASAAGRKKRKRGLRRTERGRRGGGDGAPWWTRARACVWNRDETRRSGRWTPGRPWRTPCCSSAAWWCGSKCGGVWFRGSRSKSENEKASLRDRRLQLRSPNAHERKPPKISLKNLPSTTARTAGPFSEQQPGFEQALEPPPSHARGLVERGRGPARARERRVGVLEHRRVGVEPPARDGRRERRPRARVAAVSRRRRLAASFSISSRRRRERVASSAGLSHARPSNGGEPCGFAMCPMLRSRSSLRERRKEDGRAPNARAQNKGSSSRANRVATSAFSAAGSGDALVCARAKREGFPGLSRSAAALTASCRSRAWVSRSVTSARSSGSNDGRVGARASSRDPPVSVTVSRL